MMMVPLLLLLLPTMHYLTTPCHQHQCQRQVLHHLTLTLYQAEALPPEVAAAAAVDARARVYSAGPAGIQLD
jgi:hypothetical protein